MLVSECVHSGLRTGEIRNRNSDIDPCQVDEDDLFRFIIHQANDESFIEWSSRARDSSRQHLGLFYLNPFRNIQLTELVFSTAEQDRGSALSNTAQNHEDPIHQRFEPRICKVLGNSAWTTPSTHPMGNREQENGLLAALY